MKPAKKCPRLVRSLQELERELADLQARGESATTSIPLNRKTTVNAYFQDSCGIKPLLSEKYFRGNGFIGLHSIN